jgi:hypothetical protein
MRVAIQSNNLRPFNRPGEVAVPVGEKFVTWIVVDKDGVLQSTKTVAGKCEMLLNAEPLDKFYMVWTGNYTTDIFPVSFADLRAATHDWKIWHPEPPKKAKTKRS